jgi:hypothetical protein
MEPKVVLPKLVIMNHCRWNKYNTIMNMNTILTMKILTILNCNITLPTFKGTHAIRIQYNK